MTSVGFGSCHSNIFKINVFSLVSTVVLQQVLSKSRYVFLSKYMMLRSITGKIS